MLVDLEALFALVPRAPGALARRRLAPHYQAEVRHPNRCAVTP